MPPTDRSTAHADFDTLVFHAHLEACAQCRTKPFALCVIGGVLLALAASNDQEASDAPAV